MKNSIKAIARELFGRRPFPNLNPDKKELIDFASERLGMRSFADLGGVWNVDGGYTFHAMEEHHIGHAILVDTDVTPAVLELQKKHLGLKVLQGQLRGPLNA